MPAELHAVVTYTDSSAHELFAQDDTGGIGVILPPNGPEAHPGDSVVIRGITVAGYTSDLRATEMRAAGAGRLPAPRPVTWPQILSRTNDGRYVSIAGIVHSATLQSGQGEDEVALTRRPHAAPDRSLSTPNPQPRYLLMEVQTDGGLLRVHMENAGGIDPLLLLDARVRLEGVAGGLFDGKLQLIGAELRVSGPRHMAILRPSSRSPADLPLTEISGIMAHSYVRDESERVHLRGSITMVEPGLQMVVESPNRSAVVVHTNDQSPLQVGQVVDVLGFPDPQDDSPAIRQANIVPTATVRAIRPLPASWQDAVAGLSSFDLVSMEGRLAAEFHEPHQDALLIQAGDRVFSARLPRNARHAGLAGRPLFDYRIGSDVRVTGVCLAHAAGPGDAERWFELVLRTPGDVLVLRDPPWWTVRRLLYLSGAMLAVTMVALLWAIILHLRVRRQADQLRCAIEVEAARERRVALLEAERARVLEAINSRSSLDEVLGMILRLVGSQLPGRSCWCELQSGTRIGDPASADSAITRRDFYSGSGERLGCLVVAGGSHSDSRPEVLEMGASLAALAIDNRRLYETLMHRSQYDQLTNAANRFLLEARLDEALFAAARNRSRCAVIYMDLDEFKQVNDLYGHRVGDLYLQQVTQRFSEKLRGMDTLARIGGDEFIALIPMVRSHAEVEEIAGRISRCFDLPFLIDTHSIRGSVSIGFAVYPDDAQSKEDLKRVADAAMYQRKSSPVR